MTSQPDATARTASHPAALALPPSRLLGGDGCQISLATALGERIIVVEPSDGEVRANLAWVHGLSDHAARQVDTARWLAARGYRTLLFDGVGHGGSASPRGASFWIVQHYLEHADPSAVARAIRDDPRCSHERTRRLAADQFERLARSTFDDHLRQVLRMVGDVPRLVGDQRPLPLFLVGHSMGALLVAETVWKLAERGRVDIRGAVLLCPAVKPQGNPASRAEQLAIETLWRLRRLPVSFTRRALKAALRLNFAADTTWGNRWLSDHAAEVELFGTDPLVPRVLPTGYASSIESQMVRTEGRGHDFPGDGLVMVPGEDGITSLDAGVRFARNIAATIGEERMRLVQFADVCAHDLMRSSVRDQARAVLGDWLDQRATLTAGRGERFAA